jgi:hypothetical protein
MNIWSVLLKHFPFLLEFYKTAIMYNLSLFAAALIGSFTLRALLIRGIKTLKNQEKISGNVAFIAKLYFTLKALITPFVFVFISINNQIHKTEKYENNIVIDRWLVTFNEASGLLTPELHIITMMMNKK